MIVTSYFKTSIFSASKNDWEICLVHFFSIFTCPQVNELVWLMLPDEIFFDIFFISPQEHCMYERRRQVIVRFWETAYLPLP